MTALAKTDIPATIDSVEKLAVWCLEVLQHLYPNTVVVELLDDNGKPVQSRVIESTKFYLTAPATPHWRHIGRSSIQLAAAHQVSGKIWQHAQDLGNLAIPAGMRE